jgi:hypothetical protein
MSDNNQTMNVTPDDMRKYNENHGQHCPFCHAGSAERDHDGLSWDDLEVDGNQVFQRVTCGKCGREWHDVYKRDSIFWSKPDIGGADIPNDLVAACKAAVIVCQAALDNIESKAT